MQSFQKEKKAVKTVQNVLILLCRLVALAFLILAFSQPFYNAANKSLEAKETIVSIHVDNSFSMSAMGSEGELLSEAKIAAKNLIDKYPKNQRFRISSNELSTVQRRIMNTSDALNEVDAIQYSPIQRTFNTVFNWQQKNEEQQRKKGEKRKYFENIIFSDFQKDFFQLKNIQEDSLSFTTLLQLKPQVSANCYVDSIWFKSKTHRIEENNELFFRVINVGKDELINIELNIRAHTFSKDLFLNIPQESEFVSSVTLPAQAQKYVQGTVELRDRQMYWDDQFYFSFQTEQKSEILIVNGEKAEKNITKAFKTEDFFEVQETTIEQVNQSLFRNKELIVLNGIEFISSGLRADIVKFESKGGTVFVLPSSGMNIQEINSLLKALKLPEIKEIKSTNIKATSLSLKDPVFSGVFEKEQQSIALPRFKTVYKTDYKNTSAIPLMTLRDQTPILFKSLRNSFALYSCLDRDCSDFTENTLFPVLCLRIGELSGVDSKNYHFIGQDTPIELPVSNKVSEGPVKIQNDKTDFIPKIIQDGSYKYIDISGTEAIENLKQGNFFLVKEDTLKVLSLNYDRNESSVALMDVNLMESLLKQNGIKNVSSSGFTKAIDVSKIKLNLTKEFWRICIFISIMAIFCEILIAKFWKN